MQSLRHIAVTVEESGPGRFAWVLIERIGRNWRNLDRAAAPARTYAAAMSEGLLALQSLVEDLDTGPRVEHSSAYQEEAPDRPEPEEQAEAKAEKAEAKKQQPSTKTKPGKSFFGFGPVR